MLELTNINYVIILIEGMLFQKQFKNRKKFPLIIVSVQLILLLGLRNFTVGGDTQTYVQYFLYTVNGGIVNHLEWGARYLMVLLAQITSAPTVMLLVYAAMTILPVSYVSYKSSENIFFSMIIYAGLMFYYWAFNAMRQAAAMSFGLMALYYLNEGKTKKYFIWLLLATAFHKSAVVVLVYLLIKKSKIRINKNWIFILPMVSCFMMVFGDKLLLFFLRFFDSYIVYMSKDGYFGRGNVIHPLLFLSIFIFLTFVHVRYDEQIDFGLCLLAVGVILYFVSIRVKVVNRLPYYFTIPLVVLLPNTVEALHGNNKKISKAVFYIGISIYQLILVLQGAQGIVPYRFFWQ